jgi:hypothetical protein
MLLKPVRKAMKVQPPSAEVLGAAGRLLDPGPMPKPRDMRPNHAPYLLWRELDWRRQPEAKKREEARRGHHKPVGIVAVLAAVTTYMDEREGRGFPGDAEDTAKVRAILNLFRLQPVWRKGRGRRVPATVVRMLVKRLRAAPVLGVYVLIIARAVTAANQAKQREIAARMPASKPAARIIEQPQRRPTMAELMIAKYVDRIQK